LAGAPSIEPAAREEATHAAADSREQAGNVGVGRGCGRVELQGAALGLGEDPVEHERVEVDVQVQPTPEALDHGDGASLRALQAAPACAAAVVAEDRPDVHRQYRAAEPVVPGDEVPEAMGHCENPLPHGYARQHLVHEVRGLLGHASTAAAWAEAPPLARERHEPFVGAVAAAHSGKAARQDATREELPNSFSTKCGT